MTAAQTTTDFEERAECGRLGQLLPRLGRHLDDFLRFEHADAMASARQWQAHLGRPVPHAGAGIEAVIEDLGRWIVIHGSPIGKPGFTSFITTGPATAGVLAHLVADIAGPQRLGLTAFQFLEGVSLDWMKALFGLPHDAQGIYTSGGSVANLLALGAARQQAFEAIGVDPARQGVSQRARVFASAESHHSILRACAVLGLGRDALVRTPCDAQGRMRTDELVQAIEQGDGVPVAIVGNLGTTNSGTIDPITALTDIARAHRIWLHLDGAYGLPGILDPALAPLYHGLEHADSVIVDPHKWLGAPVGIGTAFVRDKELLQRAFTQEAATYLEGTVSEQAQHSMDQMGTPYNDMGVELSAPSRGAVVWALIREIGVEGLRARVCRHNAMASWLAEQARADPHLELLREPQLSICCFRYVDARIDDLDELNRQLHRRLLHNNQNLPSTTLVNGKLALRPCFIGARSGWPQAEALLEEVRQTGAALVAEWTGPSSPRPVGTGAAVPVQR